MQSTDQYLVLVNVGDEQHRIEVTVSAAADDILTRTVELAGGERQRLPLNVTEPRDYTVSVTIDDDTTETWQINFDDYDLRESVDVFVEFGTGRPNLYWEE